jgi:hypothetical protein
MRHKSRNNCELKLEKELTADDADFADLTLILLSKLKLNHIN